jgi:hypothetical protein
MIPNGLLVGGNFDEVTPESDVAALYNYRLVTQTNTILFLHIFVLTYVYLKRIFGRSPIVKLIQVNILF